MIGNRLEPLAVTCPKCVFAFAIDAPRLHPEIQLCHSSAVAIHSKDRPSAGCVRRMAKRQLRRADAPVAPNYGGCATSRQSGRDRGGSPCISRRPSDQRAGLASVP